MRLLLATFLFASVLHGVPTEVDGLLAVEAEAFSTQTLATVRAWRLTTTEHSPGIIPDGDPSHASDASGGAYLELLPDTRRTDQDTLVKGENLSNVPGQMAVLSYAVVFDQPGRYYFWARAYSTGTEDNGLHVGLDDTWPESGARWQTTQKYAWHWECRQRTNANHQGEPMQLWLDVPTAGAHTVQISMREDGFELDKWILARDLDYRPAGFGPTSPSILAPPAPPVATAAAPELIAAELRATDFAIQGTAYYLDAGKWLAINPANARTASVSTLMPVGNGRFHVMLDTVGESDGRSTYEVLIGGRSLGSFETPLAPTPIAEGPAYNHRWENIEINEGEALEIRSTIGSTDGKEFARARWSRIRFAPIDGDPGKVPATLIASTSTTAVPLAAALVATARQADAAPAITIRGELKLWHTLTLDLAGPFAHELDLRPNPFTDYALNVTFVHESGAPSYVVPGYFAADGDAANTGAQSGTVWRAHLSPDRTGTWTYTVSFFRGPNAATYHGGRPLAPYDGLTGRFVVAPSDKTAPDFRARGRLTYTGERYLRFAGDGQPFLKAGTDAPETLLAYTDFDNMVARKANVPLKTWAPHRRDWHPGDPTWHDVRGKGLIGALNYLAAAGANSVSFLTYNAAGDGDNVWPFVERDDKFHYDVSKLAQWEIVFAHAQHLGLYLHFKLQENEMDDHRKGSRRNTGIIPEAMDAGETGPERRLYFRELIARFGHHLALNWNFGEENTQSYEEQIAMFDYVASLDPYGHHRVIHTFPNDQDRIYLSLLGSKSNLTGASMQNAWDQAHARTHQWVEASAAAGRPWVVANDEQNPAGLGVPPDPGYQGFDGIAGEKDQRYDLHGIRKYTLWGNLMAGGAGVEYYFGYRLAENDLLCEDFRSRDRSWAFAKVAVNFFHALPVDLAHLQPADSLVGTAPGANGNWCLAAPGQCYVVYLPEGGEAHLDLSASSGPHRITWTNPRDGPVGPGEPTTVPGGGIVVLTPPTDRAGDDWVAVIVPE